MENARRTVTAGVMAMALAVAGCASSDPGPSSVDLTPSSTDAGVGLEDADLWLSFEDSTVGDDGATEYPDALGGPYVGRVVTADDGQVEQVPGWDEEGAGAGFPAPCRNATGCPRALVEIAEAAALDPGDEPFTYGVAVRLDPTEVSIGANIVQKGRFATEGGQWKLQIDGLDGEPSCVVRGADGELTVRSGVSVADGEWHRVECRRDDAGLGIAVDGSADFKAGATGVVDNDEPLRIGSPGVGDGDDQFFGRLDDVFVRFGPEE